MGFLKRLFRSNRQPAVALRYFDAPIKPEQAFAVVGDLHGALAQFEGLDAVLLQNEMQEAPLIFVGDYVDRGENSAEILRRLMPLQKESPERVICLMGNHERMMLDVLRNPAKHGPRWLKHGGLQTVDSFGVAPVLGIGSEEEWSQMASALREAMGEELITWLQELPLSWQSGNVFVCHAGADPMVPLEYQSKHVLLWGSDMFEHMVREDAQWVVHGHTIVPQAMAKDGRISIDTGCYATGRLTCAIIRDEGTEFCSITM